MRDHAEAKDVLQDTLISMFKNLDQYKLGEGSFKAWIKRICINNALQKFRKKSYSHEMYFDEIPDEKVVMPDVYATLGAEELMKVINTIPDLYRKVFCLYVVEDYTHAEIADKLEMKESSSRSALTRAKKMIREKLYELQKVVA